MLTLQEIFDTLATGELSNISARQDLYDTIDEVQYPRIINHINLGLNKLYERFNLLQDTLKLHQRLGVEKYYLRKEHAGIITDISDDIYIELPAGTEFKDNFIKLLAAYNIDDEFDTPINDLERDNSILISAFDSLYIPPIDMDVYPYPTTTTPVLELTYQAHYPKIELSVDLNPSTYELHIPRFILDALQYFIASKVYQPMGNNSSTADADKSMSYQQLYELACTKIESYGLATDASTSSTNFDSNGFR